MLTILVSGKAFTAGLDPMATGVPREEGWPSPKVRKVGTGRQYVYRLTREQADVMSDHLATLGESLMYSSEPEDRAEGRACLAAAVRIRATVALAD